MDSDLMRVRAELVALRDAAIEVRGGRDGLPEHMVTVELGTRRECWAYLEGAKYYIALAKALYEDGARESGDMHLAMAETWFAIASICYHQVGVA
jgi:hypothetical protein